jgi:hypothetical protein
MSVCSVAAVLRPPAAPLALAAPRVLNQGDQGESLIPTSLILIPDVPDVPEVPWVPSGA